MLAVTKQLINPLALALPLAISSVTHAATADMDLQIDWESLLITGSASSGFQQTTITDPFNGGQVTSDASAWVGANGDDKAEEEQANGATVLVEYAEPGLYTEGGYDADDNVSGGNVSINNNNQGNLSAWGGGDQFLIFQATQSGEVTVSINFTVTGSASVNPLFESAGGGFSIGMEAENITTFITNFPGFITPDCDEECADDKASELSLINEFEIQDDNFLSAAGCPTPSCNDNNVLADTLSTTFTVSAGELYGVGVGGSAWAYSYSEVAPVPVPAAIWFFGSALLGLSGIARRRSA